MESWIPLLLVLIPALPLAGAALTAALGRPVLAGRSHLPVMVGIAGSFLAAAALVLAIHGSLPAGANHQEAADSVKTGYERTVDLWNWAVIGGAYDQPTGADASVLRDFRIDVTLRADPLTAIMLAMVTFISLLVAVYSVGYMQGDRGYLAVFCLHRAVCLLDDDARLGEQFPPALRVLGSRRVVQLLADRFLRTSGRRRQRRARRPSGQPDRRFRFCFGRLFDLDRVRNA